MSKRILDIACGSKMFWFNKHNPDVEFCDNRTIPYHTWRNTPAFRHGDISHTLFSRKDCTDASNVVQSGR